MVKLAEDKNPMGQRLDHKGLEAHDQGFGQFWHWKNMKKV